MNKRVPHRNQYRGPNNYGGNQNNQQQNQHGNQQQNQHGNQQPNQNNQNNPNGQQLHPQPRISSSQSCVSAYSPGMNSECKKLYLQNTAAVQRNKPQYQPNAQYTTPAAVRSGSAGIRSGPCVACESTTVLMCQRCGDFFCSPSCQQEKWPEHRYICFQMPQLVNSLTRLSHDIPALNGYQNREGPQIMRAGSPATQDYLSYNRKWVNGPSPGPQSPPPQQRQHNQQQHQQYNQKQHHSEQQPQHQQQKQNTTTPPKLAPKELEKLDNNKRGAVNIGKVEQVAYPKSNSNVVLTAFRSSNRLFVRSIEKAENEAYKAVIKSINDFGRTAGPLKMMPTRNTFAISDFAQDGLFYRVQVVNAKNENEIRVVYYDFGNEETKKFSELKEISKECAELKQYIVPATLKNVPFANNSDKLKEFLKKFEDFEANIIYNEKEKPECEIVLLGTGENLNQTINSYLQKEKAASAPQQKQQQQPQQNVTQSKRQVVQEEKCEPPKPVPPTPQVSAKQTQLAKSRPSQLVKPVMIPPFDIVYLPEKGKNLNVVVVDNSLMIFGYFACVLSDDKTNLQTIQNYLSEYDDKGRPYKPKAEEYCLAKFEGEWYRAKALSILSDEFIEVVFIDFLNESQISVKDIRRYPMDLEFPCKTSFCLIDGLPTELADDMVEHLKNKLQPGSEHKINEVKGMEEDTNVVIVQMNQIVQWLATVIPT